MVMRFIEKQIYLFIWKKSRETNKKKFVVFLTHKNYEYFNGQCLIHLKCVTDQVSMIKVTDASYKPC